MEVSLIGVVSGNHAANQKFYQLIKYDVIGGI
jgi:hypothetical protein